MSPDSPIPSRQRRAWRVMSCAGCVLGAASILLTAQLWSRTNDALHEIQRSRIDVCRQTNQRHDDTIRVLDARIAVLRDGQRTRAEANRSATIALIQALAPKRNCVATLTPPSAKR